MNFLTLLPLAFVMIAGPQILSAIFLATSEDWRGNSAPVVLGAALSITAFVTVAFLLNGVSDAGDSSDDTLYVIVLVLLVAAAVHTFLARDGAAQVDGQARDCEPQILLHAGLPAARVFPTDILTSLAVGSYLAAHGDAWWHALPFIGLALLFLSVPALTVVALGERGKRLLPKVRNWMNENSWVVNEVVIAFS